MPQKRSVLQYNHLQVCGTDTRYSAGGVDQFAMCIKKRKKDVPRLMHRNGRNRLDSVSQLHCYGVRNGATRSSSGRHFGRHLKPLELVKQCQKPSVKST